MRELFGEQTLIILIDGVPQAGGGALRPEGHQARVLPRHVVRPERQFSFAPLRNPVIAGGAKFLGVQFGRNWDFLGACFWWF